ncbi:MAG: hypothetical protein PHO60_01625 [Methanothrix sp.]|nr:hypothetical protein [Methanothrix sp.]
MRCKSLKMMAMVCLLAAVASISVGMASEEGATDLSAINAADEVTMTDEVDGMDNESSLNSTDQSSNESSAEDADVSVVSLSTLEDGSKAGENADVTVISYMPPNSSNDADGVEENDTNVTDVRILSNVLGSSAAENVTDLSALDEASDETDGAKPIDVRVLGDVLGAYPAENVTDLSTLGETATALGVTNATETGPAALSSTTTNESQVTDVMALSEILGY